jgi:hypothetical protein
MENVTAALPTSILLSGVRQAASSEIAIHIKTSQAIGLANKIGESIITHFLEDMPMKK